MMKFLASIVTVCCLISTVMAAQYSDEALKSARELSGAIKSGDMQWMIDKMYPLRKRQLLKNVPGGEPAFLRQMQQASEQLKKIQFKVEKFNFGQPSGEHVVNFKREVVVFIPTNMVFSFVAPNGQTHRVEKQSYMIAVKSLKDQKSPWYFMDGKDMNANLLRNMFYDLPENVALPASSEKILK